MGRDDIVCTVREPNTGTSNANTFTLTAPFTAKTVTNGLWTAGGLATDNGTLLSLDLWITSASATFTLLKGLAAAGWTNSGNKSANAFTIRYPIA